MTQLPPQSLFIAGVPAAGKTHFCNWLVETRGYVHLDFEKAESVGSNGVEAEVSELQETGNPQPLMKALASKARPVAFNWGFVPDAYPFVKSLLEFGMSPVWFAASRELARKEFIIRGGIRVEFFDIQMNRIGSRQNELAQLFKSCVVWTIDENGNRLQPESIYAEIAKSYGFK